MVRPRAGSVHRRIGKDEATSTAYGGEAAGRSSPGGERRWMPRPDEAELAPPARGKPAGGWGPAQMFFVMTAPWAGRRKVSDVLA
jgi:hypothetical protein